jgi:hypothetical protein
MRSRLMFFPAWIIAWNVILGIGLWVDRIQGRDDKFFWTLGCMFAGLGSSSLCASLLWFRDFRVRAIRVEALSAIPRATLLYLGLLSGLMGIACLATVVLHFIQ